MVQTDELENPEYTSNHADRCYHCKDTLYRELRSLADSLGLEAILDGTQVDDLSDDRHIRLEGLHSERKNARGRPVASPHGQPISVISPAPQEQPVVRSELYT